MSIPAFCSIHGRIGGLHEPSVTGSPGNRFLDEVECTGCFDSSVERERDMEKVERVTKSKPNTLNMSTFWISPPLNSMT